MLQITLLTLFPVRCFPLAYNERHMLTEKTHPPQECLKTSVSIKQECRRRRPAAAVADNTAPSQDRRVKYTWRRELLPSRACAQRPRHRRTHIHAAGRTFE